MSEFDCGSWLSFPVPGFVRPSGTLLAFNRCRALEFIDLLA
jgi:hypothetical protein